MIAYWGKLCKLGFHFQEHVQSLDIEMELQLIIMKRELILMERETEA
jgi:hypothetical protein